MPRSIPYSFTKLSLTLAFVAAGAACSDSSDKKVNPDGGKTVDAKGADTRVADSGLANPDGKGIDAPVVDAARLDGPVDAPMVDVGAGDAGAGDAGAGDAGDPLVARGRYLVNAVIACSDCHTPQLPSGGPDMSKFMAGNAAFVKLPSGAALPTPNLTPDPATGLGAYSAAQIKRMILDGIVPGADGGVEALNPFMPYYVFHNMADEDADAIVAYLQSLPPVANPIPERSPEFAVPAPANYLDPATIPMPAATFPERASALRGRYLATEIGLCIECHTPHPASGPDAIDPSKYFQGGEDYTQIFLGTLNIKPVSRNLTSDSKTGLGNWEAADIVTVLKKGVDFQGNGICPPMPVGPMGAYGGLTDGDALDIANYIKSLPPAVNEIPDMCSWPPRPLPDGGVTDAPSVDGATVDPAGDAMMSMD